MIEAMGIILVNVGAISGFWGFLWFLWDKRSTAPGYLLGVGLVAVIVGGLMT